MNDINKKEIKQYKNHEIQKKIQQTLCLYQKLYMNNLNDSLFFLSKTAIYEGLYKIF